MLQRLRALIFDHHQLFNQPQEPVLKRFMNIFLYWIPIGIISFISSQISHDFKLVSCALCGLLFQRLGFISKLFVLNIKLFNLSFQSQILFKHRICLVFEFSDLELGCLSYLGRYGLPLRILVVIVGSSG